jgi:hypothetical protein
MVVASLHSLQGAAIYFREPLKERLNLCVANTNSTGPKSVELADVVAAVPASNNPNLNKPADFSTTPVAAVSDTKLAFAKTAPAKTITGVKAAGATAVATATAVPKATSPLAGSNGPAIKPSGRTAIVSPKAPPVPKRPLPARLPANWMEAKDDKGNVYFYNSVTSVTQWERPV